MLGQQIIYNCLNIDNNVLANTGNYFWACAHYLAQHRLGLEDPASPLSLTWRWSEPTEPLAIETNFLKSWV